LQKFEFRAMKLSQNISELHLEKQTYVKHA
jgi:hypothetical protein